MELQINPPDAEKTLPYLNACFPGWGDERSFRWVYQRAMQNQPAPDYLVLKEGEAVIAGSGVNYREVLLRNGRAVTAGIMTGSWTLPEARGKGCFNRMIQESVRLTEQRGGALLLAFVTQENPSCRQLWKAGAAQISTSYWNAPPRASTVSPRYPFREVACIPEELFNRWSNAKEGSARFGYTSFADWQSQFVNRPAKILLLQHGHDFAVLEDHQDTFRLRAYLGEDGEVDIDFLGHLRDYSSQRGKKLFHFCTDPETAENLQDTSFIKKPGYITVLVADWKRLGEALGQTAPEAVLPHTVVAQPTSPWFLGCWRLQAGDRM